MENLNKNQTEVISFAEKVAKIGHELSQYLTTDIAQYYAINIGNSKAERVNFQFYAEELAAISDWLSQFLFSSIEPLLNNNRELPPSKTIERLFIHFNMIITAPALLNNIEKKFDKLIRDRQDYDMLFSGKLVTELSNFSHLYSLDENIIREIVAEQFTEAEKTSAQIIKPDFVGSIFDGALYNKIFTNPELLRQLHWRDFEKMLAKILETFEYEIELSKGSKDGGIDLIAVKKNSDFGEHKYLIQAKRYTNKVGVEPVQRLLFLRQEYNASKACLVTTSQFTSGAWQYAKDYNYLLELKDYDKLQEWIQKASYIEQNKHLKI